MDYDWPGNVHQPENAVSHAVILAQKPVIERGNLPQYNIYIPVLIVLTFFIILN